MDGSMAWKLHLIYGSLSGQSDSPCPSLVSDGSSVIWPMQRRRDDGCCPDSISPRFSTATTVFHLLCNLQFSKEILVGWAMDWMHSSVVHWSVDYRERGLLKWACDLVNLQWKWEYPRDLFTSNKSVAFFFFSCIHYSMNLFLYSFN